MEPKTRPTRRLLVTGGALAAAAVAADAIASPRPAAAADGDAVRIGAAGVSGTSEGAGQGVKGSAPRGDGVEGSTYATTRAGVYGRNWSGGVGVRGTTSGASAAVAGTTSGAGAGVLGSSAHGPGIVAQGGGTGPGLKVEGRAEFKLSGVAVVRALANSAGVRGLKLTAASIVLATIQQDRPGVAVASAVVDTVTMEGFTIRLNVPVLADTKVGWFVVN